MLLINKSTTPENTIYHIAAVSQEILIKKGELTYSNLYNSLTEEYYKRKINFSSFMLSLDFLFLLNKINVDKKGKLYVIKRNEIS